MRASPELVFSVSPANFLEVSSSKTLAFLFATASKCGAGLWLRRFLFLTSSITSSAGSGVDIAVLAPDV
jgi:hypothetical protein